MIRGRWSNSTNSRPSSPAPSANSRQRTTRSEVSYLAIDVKSASMLGERPEDPHVMRRVIIPARALDPALQALGRHHLPGPDQLCHVLAGAEEEVDAGQLGGLEE